MNMNRWAIFVMSLRDKDQRASPQRCQAWLLNPFGVLGRPYRVPPFSLFAHVKSAACWNRRRTSLADLHSSAFPLCRFSCGGAFCVLKGVGELTQFLLGH